MFIDSNVFITYYMDGGKQGQGARQLVKKLYSGEQNAATSSLVINEVCHFFMHHGGLPVVEKVHQQLLSLPNLAILAIDDRIARLSIEYMREGLDVSDSFHAATMKAGSLDTICSYDKAFDKVKGIKRQEPR
jgi:predicted nucleic acid-binding protein